MKVGVVAAVPDEWDAPLQVRHQVLSRLAERFPVVWMPPPPSRADFGRKRERPLVEQPEPARLPGLTVYRGDKWLPKLYRPSRAARWLARMRLWRARGLLRRQGCDTFIYYQWRPDPIAMEAAGSFDVRAYHIDDEYTFSEEDQSLQPGERVVLGLADRVFIHSDALLEKKGGINPCTTHLPNGVDFEAFSRRREEPADLAAVPRPRIGYVGVLKKQLDWQLVDVLTREEPDMHFVLVGPLAPHPQVHDRTRGLVRRANVHILGGRAAEDLPAYVQHMDVCIMPYVIDGYTRYIDPLKLREYLAAGRPTVGTPLQAMERFRDVLWLPRSTGEWRKALREAVTSDADTPERQASRQAAVRHLDWTLLVDRLAETLLQDVGRFRAGQPSRSLPS